MEYVRRNILQQSEQDIKDIDKQIDGEKDTLLAHAEFQAQQQVAATPQPEGE